MKRLIILFALVVLGLGASAQSFFTPVTAEQLTSTTADSDKGLTGTFLIRPEFTIAGNVLKPVFIDGEFTAMDVSWASRVGMGVSYSLYKLVEGEPYNVYSFAAQVSLATIEKPAAGLLVTASAFDFYGLSPAVGIGYDFVKNSPAKANWYIMWGFNRTF